MIDALLLQEIFNNRGNCCGCSSPWGEAVDAKLRKALLDAGMVFGCCKCSEEIVHAVGDPVVCEYCAGKKRMEVNDDRP